MFAGAEPPSAWSGRLKAGSVYAICVQTAAARGALLSAPLSVALAEGRPCVLITPLDPERGELDVWLFGASGANDFSAALETGRLKVFSTQGDSSVSLFLRGAQGYVNELEYHQIEPGSLIVVDQADDLFTPHDHHAVERQAHVYEQWCLRHSHTMLLLHLRTHASQPLLGGNQAALRHFAGVAQVVAEADGLWMKVDFWWAPHDYQLGMVTALASRAQIDGRLVGSAGAKAGPQRQRVWYVGPYDAALEALSHRIQWRLSESLEELLQARERLAGTNVLIALRDTTDFQRLVDRMVHLRCQLDPDARIVVRELRYRLREHLQRRWLLRAGVDAVLSVTEPPAAWVSLLEGRRSGAAVHEINAGSPSEEGWSCGLSDAERSGWLPVSRFIHEARAVVGRSHPMEVPCTLAEVQVNSAAEGEAGMAPSQGTRLGDLWTRTDDVHLFLLQGCRESQALQVVGRWIGPDGTRCLRRISLFTGAAAIAERLAQLQPVFGAETPTTETAEGLPTRNLVTMSGKAGEPRSGLRHGKGLLMALAFVILWQPASESDAQTVAGAASRAYDAAQYETAARLGLEELDRTPDDPALRLKVANSLAWTGQYPEAIRQYEALAGTPLAEEAAVGLANVHLWTGRPHLADPLFRRVLASNPDQADARAGLAAAQRHLRPRTTVLLDSADDSSEVRRRGVSVSHRWRDASLLQVFELAARGGREEQVPIVPDLKPREASLSYEHLGLSFMPKVRITAEADPHTRLYGEASVTLAGGAVTLDGGYVNWGRLAFSPQAWRDKLSANRLGIAGLTDAAIGRLQGSFTHYAVSDGNRIDDLNLQYTPAWQPFPGTSGVKVFAGAYARKAARVEDRYWSPASGFYTGNVGLAWGRWEADWEAQAEIKRSLRAGGEGAEGWSGGIGGKRWLNQVWAVQADFSYLETTRFGSSYRARSVTMAFSRLW